VTAWSAFTSLWRAMTGRDRTPLAFEADWADLLGQLGLPPHTFRDVLEADSLDPHFCYRRYAKPKKGGGLRRIAEPDARLKRVQQAIVTRYLTPEEPHPAAVAYQPGLSTADHVWAHAGAQVVVAADVRDFFPSTHTARVEDWWHQRAEGDEARLLTLLTTDRGGLPQGAPTSPGLSNLVNREMDERLARRAERAGARYTRYCDDLCFSWSGDRGPPSDFQPVVRATLGEFGYSLHPEKGWRIYERRDEPEITGVILTRFGGVRLPERLRQLMRRLSRSNDARDAERLAGYYGYAENVTRRPERTK